MAWLSLQLPSEEQLHLFIREDARFPNCSGPQQTGVSAGGDGCLVAWGECGAAGGARARRRHDNAFQPPRPGCWRRGSLCLPAVPPRGSAGPVARGEPRFVIFCRGCQPVLHVLLTGVGVFEAVHSQEISCQCYSSERSCSVLLE